MRMKSSDVDRPAAVGPDGVAKPSAAHRLARSPRRWARVVAAGLLVGSAACTLLLDRSATQCQVDGDCLKFGGHPFCQSNVCVDSGLGPPDCFYGTPQTQAQFQNQCTTSQWFPFDDCKRVKSCGSSLPTPMPPPSPDASAPAPAATADSGGGDAATLPNCLDPANGRANVVFITGSSNFPPLLAKVAPLIIAANGTVPVFQTTNSCTGVKSVVNSAAIHDPAPGASPSKFAAYYGADGSQTPCLLGSAGVQVDIGESDIYATTCDGVSSLGSAMDSPGPIQAMAFVVPGGSQETAISAAAALEVFGLGGNGGTAIPWINPTQYFVRNANTGTQQMIGHAINVQANQFWGTDVGSAQAVDQTLKVIVDFNEAQQSIGIISVDWYDSDRKNLNALAYKGPGQECAYLPDSTADSTDKRNVRDGHYPIWGPLHFLTTVPPSNAAAAFLSVVNVPRLPQAVLDAFIGASLVPSCAMMVKRDIELGNLSAYSPSYRCGCYFESKKGNGTLPPECTSCDGTHPCPTGRPACNLGFCEVE